MSYGQDTLKTAKMNQKYGERSYQIYYSVSLIAFVYRLIYELSLLKSAVNLVFGCFRIVNRHRRRRRSLSISLRMSRLSPILPEVI